MYNGMCYLPVFICNIHWIMSHMYVSLICQICFWVPLLSVCYVSIVWNWNNHFQLSVLFMCYSAKCPPVCECLDVYSTLPVTNTALSAIRTHRNIDIRLHGFQWVVALRKWSTSLRRLEPRGRCKDGLLDPCKQQDILPLGGLIQYKDAILPV